MLVADTVLRFLSKGDGSFIVGSQTPGGNFGTPPTAAWTQIPGDFNGDGKSDFAMLAGTTILTLQANGPPFHRLTTVTTGTGASTSVAYQPVPVANLIWLAVDRESGDAAARCWICAD